MRKLLLLALLCGCKQPPPEKHVPVPIPAPVPSPVSEAPDASVEAPDAGAADAGLLLIADDGGVVEQEPNDKTPQEVALPLLLKGLIWPPGDLDAYRFHVAADHAPVSFVLSPPPAVDLRLRLKQLHDGAEEIIGSTDRLKLLSVPLKEGDYAVEVSGLRNRDASKDQPYTLSVK
jgi:hypothetical protein